MNKKNIIACSVFLLGLSVVPNPASALHHEESMAESCRSLSNLVCQKNNTKSSLIQNLDQDHSHNTHSMTVGHKKPNQLGLEGVQPELYYLIYEQRLTIPSPDHTNN